MTSLLKSKSDVLSRRVLYLATDRAVVYHWDKGQLTQSFVFHADATGLEQFARYLFEVQSTPFYILLDVVEEEYRIESIPHVMGPDRKALIERKKDRLFRNTPYCHATLQGREKDGRRDDILLFSAITNQDIPAPWLKLLANAKVPVSGMYSLPGISGQLLKKLGSDNPNTLLVTMQSASGLRQSFYKDKHLKISRLAKMPRLSTIPFGPYLLGEIEKIHRYLNSLRLIQNDEVLDVIILCQGELLEELREQFRDSDDVHYHLVDVNVAGKSVGFRNTLNVPFSDALFAHLLAMAPPANQYATREETRYHAMYRGRLGMMVASMLILLVSAVWSGFNMLDGLTYQQDQLDAREKANFYEARYRIARERLPQTAVEPYDIKAAVDLVDGLVKHRSRPEDTMLVISRALEGFPNLHLERIKWQASSDPNKIIGGGDEKDGLQNPLDLPVEDDRYLYHQISVFEGYVSPFTGDYRSALDMINNFAEVLRGLPNVRHVKVLSLPLDVSSDAALSGSADVRKGKTLNATYAIKLILGVPVEEV